jgi:hypothetical protein
MYKKFISPVRTPTPISPKRITVLTCRFSAQGKYGVRINAKITPCITVNQNVRHGLHVKGLKFNGSLITSVNNHPNVKAINALNATIAATPDKKITVFILAVFI